MTFPFSGCENAPISFTTPESGPWEWNFGDGSPTSTLQNPTHTFTSSGGYVVSLSATNGSGCTISNAASLTINPAPDAIIQTSSDPIMCTTSLPGESVTLSGLLGPPGTSYSWSTAPTPVPAPVVGPAPGNVITHAETGSAGTYVYTLEVTNGFGCIDTDTENVVETATCAGGTCNPGIVSGSVTAAPQPSPANPCTDWEFSGTFSSPGTINSWEFGDGTISSSTAATINHSYTLPGLYTVTLFVAYPNLSGPTPAVCYVPFTSLVDVPAVVDFTTQFSCTGGVVETQFIDKTLSHGGHAITNWEWYLDGVLQSWSGAYPVGSVMPGVHDVRLVVTTALGASCETEMTLDFPTPGIADFTYPAQICVDANADFTNSSTSTGGLLDWSWDFDLGIGAEGGSDLLSPTHAYVSAGMKTVQLTIVDQMGCTHSVSQIIEVLPNTLTGNMTASPGFVVCDGEIVTLTSPYNGTAGFDFTWSNGTTGGVTATVLAGQYLVEMTDGNGCYYRAGPEKVIVNPAPYAVIYGPSDACQYTSFELATTSAPGYDYTWTPTGWNSPLNYLSLMAGSYAYQVTVTDNSTSPACSSVSLLLRLKCMDRCLQPLLLHLMELEPFPNVRVVFKPLPFRTRRMGCFMNGALLAVR